MGELRTMALADADAAGRTAADLVSTVISAHPTASVVAATGRSPEALYAELAARRDAGRLDTSRITAIQLDEYLGLERDDRRSLFGWMHRCFIAPLGIPDERVVQLPLVGDLAAAGAAFDRDLAARGGVELAILGIGHNGHLGFNEPPADADSATRRVELSPSTIEANASYWGDVADVPTAAVTLGLAPLLAARTIVLVVAGRSKREILARALDGPVGPDVPASLLRRAPGDVTVIADRDALGDR
jgi:glucosamine-6-phosphate deaminase